MIAKIAEGLIGSSMAVKEMRTPLKVYNEAKAKGDQSTMDKAMGYVSNFNTDAWVHKERTENGLKQEAVETKEKAQLEREELAERIKENGKEAKERLEKASENVVNSETSNSTDTDEGIKLENPYEESETSENAKTSDNSAPITYTKAGTVKPANVDVQFSVVV